MLLLSLNGILGLVTIVCYILVVVQIFQHGETGMGLACTLGLVLCGIGGLLTFIYGWVKSAPWRLNNIMLVWSGAIVLNLILSIMARSVVIPTPVDPTAP